MTATLGTNQRALGTLPVGRLLVQYALPSIIAMTASSLYNMVDSIFIGRYVGSLGLTGLTVTFPLMNLSSAFGAMVGVGAAMVTSVKIGQREIETAEQTLGNVVLLNTVIGIMFSVVALLFLDPILYFFGASDASLPYAREYMEVLLYGNVLTHLYLGLNDVVRSSGYPRKAMAATLSAVFVNIIFDYLFIVRWDFGIRGAAFATILAQFVAFCVVLSHLLNPKSFIHFKPGILVWRKKIVVGILRIGVASFFTNVCACLVVLLINNGLKAYGGDTYIGAYGIVNRITFIFVMIANGINQGMQPIAGFNYGAGLHNRSRRVYGLAVIAGVTVMTCCFIMGEFFPESVISWWGTDDKELFDVTVNAMRIMVLVVPLAGFQIVSVGFLMALGEARKAIILSLTRQLLFLVPMLLLLPQFLGVDGIWYSLPVADLLSAVVAGFMVFGLLKKMKGKEKMQSAEA